MLKNVLIFICFLVFFALQATNRPFFTKGESREALVVQDMLSQDNFILPMRNGDEIPSKPPMFHWSAVGFSKLFGVNELAIRFPSVLYSALTFIVTLIFTKSLAASLILASSFEFNRSGTSARVDMCFCFYLTLSTFLIYKFIEQRKSSLIEVTLITIGFIGAVLSKGPAGLAFPAAITLVYGLKSFDIKNIFKQKSLYVILITAIVALAVSALWYFQAYKIGKNEFLAVHLGRENIGRFVENNSNPGHIKPFYFSFIYLLIGFLPWSLILPFSIVNIWKNRKTLLEDKLLLFSIIWGSVYFIVVTITISKRVVYLLPAYPAFAYMIAKSFNLSKWPEKICKACDLTTCAIAIFIAIAIFFDNSIIELASKLGIKAKDLEIALLTIKLLKPYALVLALSYAVLFYCQFTEKLTQPLKSAISLSILFLIFNSLIYTQVSKVLTPKYFTETLDKNLKIAFYKEPYYAFSYYAGKSLKAIQEPEAVDYIIVSEEKEEEFKTKFKNFQSFFKSNNPIINGRYRAAAYKPIKPAFTIRIN